MKKGSLKNTRINSEVTKALATVISLEVKDPRVHPMTSVTSCEVTTDLRQCFVHISVLSNKENDLKKTMEGLEKAKPFLRKRLAEIVNLRNTPEIKLIADRDIAYGMHMSELIEAVSAHDREVEAMRDEYEAHEAAETAETEREEERED